jgi:pyridoxal phosphate enzyme (YggS family)
MQTEGYLRILERINRIRPGHNVEIVGNTKKQAAETIQKVVDQGLRILANNYIQEGKLLMPHFPEAEWHFVGHVQSRKVKDLVDYDVVESLDRLEVAQKLDEKLSLLEKVTKVLIEINIGAEPQKSGIAPSELPTFLEQLKKMPHLRVAGLMGMPPPFESVEQRRPFFRQLKQLYDRYAPTGFEYLSMGTSQDYLVAVEEGANRVRLGTILFGSRD